ncbi:RrF2 family transcriptional regulator [Martelella radicis]|uniref:Rrf2 family protein n=1 Tax=Martelella radicis TaxID=1397476 RepID=A0A7W6PAI3_9HYPH|nr:Rrf2 family transcriptional regulator [Martelella radicis]MBB4121452.1 Rrf2 family protein [Martelella radicis]
MQLRNQVEWVLHAAAVLAGLPPGRYLPTKVLATFHGIPKEYLSKALQALSQAGLVESTLGPGGGYRLAAAPEDISFLDIVEAVEGKAPLFRCRDIRASNPCLPQGYCPKDMCPVAKVMLRADRAWRASLAETSLADLAPEVVEGLGPDLYEETRRWLAERSGSG